MLQGPGVRLNKTHRDPFPWSACVWGGDAHPRNCRAGWGQGDGQSPARDGPDELVVMLNSLVREAGALGCRWGAGVRQVPGGGAGWPRDRAMSK